MKKRTTQNGGQLVKERGAPPLSFTALIEALCAAHLSSYVESPFLDRGGIMLVGPPSVLKSTLLDLVARQYSEAVPLSDINARSLGQLRDAIAANAVRTLVCPELAKLYERHKNTAGNVEGTIRALVAEGFAAASWEDSRINRRRARCVFLSALTPEFQNQNFTRWEKSGFSRRFLWPLVTLRDVTVVERAIESWTLLDFRVRHVPMVPPSGVIPNTTTTAERARLRPFLEHQPGGVGAHAVQLLLLVKMLAVLKWWHEDADKAWKLVAAFAGALGEEGAELYL